jgi:AmiR/NasT family two-component response regulator
MHWSIAALTELSRLELAPEVHQASGMVAVQLGVNAATALQRLRSWAADHGKTVDEVAAEVVGLQLVLDPAPGTT